MDDLDHNLLDAWHRVMERCRKDPAEARRRWRRSRLPSCNRSPRPWCLALRACDTRIEEHAAFEEMDEPVEAIERQTVLLSSRSLRELCGPVRIPWPGVALSKAARMIGRHRESLRRYLPRRQGRTREAVKRSGIERYEIYRDVKSPVVVQYQRAQCEGHFGYDVPIVWTEGWLDPADRLTRRAHPLWGSLWQWLHKRIVKEGMLRVERAARWLPYEGGTRFRGWYWTCPGRIDPSALARGENRRLPCGRRASVLYMPMPVRTIGSFVGEEESALALNDVAAEAEDDLRLVGQWLPGLHDPLGEARCFACRHCWKVTWEGILNYADWNSFVRYISGGLLFGRDVQKPEWVTYERKHAYRRRRQKKEAHTANCSASTRSLSPRPASNRK